MSRNFSKPLFKFVRIKFFEFRKFRKTAEQIKDLMENKRKKYPFMSR